MGAPGDGRGRSGPREARERETAHGLSNGGIARAPHLPVSAIEKHVNSIFLKPAPANSPDTRRRVAAVIAYLGPR
ncbi:LuxR family transcriptional regulator [Streptosporangium canum]|uniref:LuxR family transcriptional regulator n=1 Tax=Streptosporangium canum TaxID=324952 RepID=UPI00341E2129